MFYTYVLRCSVNNNSEFYTGYTEDLKKRIEQHRNKFTDTTKKFDKIDLVYYEACLNKTDAIKREKQLKTGFGRGYINKRIKEYLATAKS